VEPATPNFGSAASSSGAGSSEFGRAGRRARLVQVSFKIEGELLAVLDEYALSRGLTRSAAIRLAVKTFLEPLAAGNGRPGAGAAITKRCGKDGRVVLVERVGKLAFIHTYEGEECRGGGPGHA